MHSDAPLLITSTADGIEFPTILAPAPRAVMRASSFGQSRPDVETRSHADPLQIDREPEWLFADGEPVAADKALAEVVDGRARIADPDKLLADFERLHAEHRPGDYAVIERRDGSLDGEALPLRVARFTRSYVSLVHALAGAEWAHRRRESADRFFADCDATGDSAFLTREQVARIFGIGLATVDRQAGQSLPAPIKLGKRVLFRRDAIARFVQAA